MTIQNYNDGAYFLACESEDQTRQTYVTKVCAKMVTVDSSCFTKKRKQTFTVYLSGNGKWCCDPYLIIERLQTGIDANDVAFNFLGDTSVLQLPSLCDPYIHHCTQTDGGSKHGNLLDQGAADPTVRLKKITFRGYVDNCNDKFTVDAEYGNDLLNENSILWGIWDGADPQVDPREVEPITSISDINLHATCQIVARDQQETDPVQSATFLGLRSQNCTGVSPADTTCCAPLAGMQGNDVLPMNSAGVPFSDPLLKQTHTQVFRVTRAIAPGSDFLYNLRQIQDGINCAGFFLYEYGKAVGDAQVCQCYYVWPKTAKIGRIDVKSATFCCAPIKLVTFEIQIKNAFCTNFDGTVSDNDGWLHRVGNIGRTAIPDCPDDGCEPVPLDDEYWLDEGGHAAQPFGTGNTCTTIEDRMDQMLDVMYQSYDAYNFGRLIDANCITESDPPPGMPTSLPDTIPTFLASCFPDPMNPPSPDPLEKCDLDTYTTPDPPPPV